MSESDYKILGETAQEALDTLCKFKKRAFRNSLAYFGLASIKYEIVK